MEKQVDLNTVLRQCVAELVIKWAIAIWTHQPSLPPSSANGQRSLTTFTRCLYSDKSIQVMPGQQPQQIHPPPGQEPPGQEYSHATTANINGMSDTQDIQDKEHLQSTNNDDDGGIQYDDIIDHMIQLCASHQTNQQDSMTLMALHGQLHRHHVKLVLFKATHQDGIDRQHQHHTHWSVGPIHCHTNHKLSIWTPNLIHDELKFQDWLKQQSTRLCEVICQWLRWQWRHQRAICPDTTNVHWLTIHLCC